jgi:nucleoside-diphosphate-sugar epimerase
MISNLIKFIPARPAEARETLANNTKAKTVLGWKPTKEITNYILENLK